MKARVVGGGLVDSDPVGIWCPTICGATFGAGAQVTLHAKSFADWRFTGWSGACSGTGPCTVDMNADASVVASFEQVAASQCAGLTPLDPGVPRIVSVPLDTGGLGATCFPAAVDGNGTLAVGRATGDSRSTGHFLFFAADGSLQGTHDYDGLHALDPEQTGFSGVAAETSGVGVYSLASDGSELNHVGNLAGQGISAADPTGGLVLVAQDSIESFDARARLRWTVPISDISGRPYAVGVNLAGQVLLLFDATGLFANTAVGGLSITHEGKRVGIFPAIPSKFTDTVLAVSPTSDGLFFVQEQSAMGGDWVRVVDPLAMSSGPPPPWLGSHGSWAARLAHDGRAYALTPSARGAFDPICTLEVTNDAGASCGSIYFDSPVGNCDSATTITVGLEGTLVQSLGVPPGCSSGCACTFRVWNGYLR